MYRQTIHNIQLSVSSFGSPSNVSFSRSNNSKGCSKSGLLCCCRYSTLSVNRRCSVLMNSRVIIRVTFGATRSQCVVLYLVVYEAQYVLSWPRFYCGASSGSIACVFVVGFQVGTWFCARSNSPGYLLSSSDRAALSAINDAVSILSLDRCRSLEITKKWRASVFSTNPSIE